MLGRLGIPTTLVLSLLGGLMVAGAPTAAAGDGEIVVTTTADVVDAGDGLVSLREAFALSDTMTGEVTIVLGEHETYERSGCNPFGSGGEIWTDPDSDNDLTIEGNGSTIQGCPEGDGFALGGLGAVTFRDLAIEQAYYALAGRGRPALLLDQVTVRESRVGVHGWSSGPMDLSMEDSTITGAEWAVIELDGNLSLHRSAIVDSTGLAISSVSGMVTIVDSILARNDIEPVIAGALYMSGSHVEDNGGGMWAGVGSGDPEVEIVDSRIVDNRGWGVRSDSTLVLRSSTVQGNGVVLWPGPQVFVGGIDAAEGAVIESSSISGNGSSGAPVGGIAVAGPVTLRNSTVAGNTGVVGGIEAQSLYADRATIAGSIGSEVDEVSVGALTAAGSIVGEGLGDQPDCEIGEVVSSSFTLYGDPDCQAGATPPDIPPTGDLVGVDPQLGPLADNGGPTWTRRPQFTSPVVDAVAGSCLGEDQRGLARPQGASCDIGAVELDAPGAPHFTDVSVAHQFFWEIECLVALEVTEGFVDGSFRPTLPISRQGVVAWLYRLAGEPPVSGVAPFSDVPAGHLFHDAILWASEEGIAEGYGDGTFRPGLSVARQGVAAWLWRMAGEPEVEDPPVFSDVAPGSLFGEPIGWLAASGVTEGFTDGTFRPTLPIARQGLAAWICRYEELES